MSDQVTLDIFNQVQQEAIIGYMMQDPAFFSRCAVILKSNYFTDTDLSQIAACAFEVFEENRTPPKKDDIALRINIKYPESGSKYIRRVDLCESSAKKISFGNLAGSMETYLQACEYTLLSNKVNKVFSARNYKEAIDTMNEGIQEIRGITFNDVDFSLMPDPRTLIHQRREESKNRLTLGNHKFDALLNGVFDIHGSEAVNSGSTNPFQKKDGKVIRSDKYPFGCLGRGNTTMILGPTNSGKTSTVVSIIVANIIANKKVLFLTHEQTEEEIQMKLAERFHGMSSAEMDTLSTQLDQKHVMDAMYVKQTTKMKNLFYRNWVDANKMYVEDVIAFINNKQAEEIAATGKGFDLIVDDYPGKLSTRSARKFSTEYAEQTFVYDQFVQLALQHKNHVILPLQVNRGGASLLKENSSGKAEIFKYVTESDVAGAFNVMHRADNIITINASPTDKKHGVIRFFIAKARSSRTNKVFTVRADLGRSTTHKERSQCIVFDEIDPISNSYADIYAALGVPYEARGSAKKEASNLDVAGALATNEGEKQP